MAGLLDSFAPFFGEGSDKYHARLTSCPPKVCYEETSASEVGMAFKNSS